MSLKTGTAPVLLTTTQASRILNISVDGVRYLARHGKLRVVMRVGSEGGRLFRRAEVEALARARAAGGRSRRRRSSEPNEAA